ncbi:MAG: M15 family metallopeptidase [Devosia sp.]
MTRTIFAILLALLTTKAMAQEAFTIAPIPDDMWAAMDGVSWHEDLACPNRRPCCPVRRDLSLLTVPYVDFGGKTQRGQLIVVHDLAEEVGEMFVAIHAAGFRIERMEPVHRYGGDDTVSMDHNNTSAFNCRTTSSGSRLSQHGEGTAIDINPVQNPYVRGTTVSPRAGAPYATPQDRNVADANAKGIISADGDVVRIFRERGWGWGGNWQNSKDYQHFSLSGT